MFLLCCVPGLQKKLTNALQDIKWKFTSNGNTIILEMLLDKTWHKVLKVLYLVNFKSIKAADKNLDPNWFSLIVIVSGTMTFKDRLSSTHLRAGDLYAVPSTATACAVGSRLKVCLLSCKIDFLLKNRAAGSGTAYMEMLTNKSPYGISLLEYELSDMMRLFAMLKNKASGEPSVFQSEIVVLCVNLILYGYCDLYYKYNQGPTAVHGRSEKIVVRFASLVERHCKAHHGVKYYADSLFVTEGHLRKAVRSVLGCSAKNFIEISIISEAYSLLADSSLPVSEISEQLHFSSSQSFSGFFKRHAKLSPTQYRLTLHPK